MSDRKKKMSNEPPHETKAVAPPAEPGTIRYAAVRGVLDLLEMVAERNRVSLGELLQRRGERASSVVALARADAIRELIKLGFLRAEVGRILGVDHSTVWYHANNGKVAKKTRKRR